MIISLNWLKKYTAIDTSQQNLEELIGSRLVEVEHITALGEKYKGVLVVKVVSVTKLEGSDHLNIVLIDDAGKKEGIERDDKGLVQVVCGAPNVRKDMMAAWLPPDSVVPETFGKEPFKLGSKPLRGVISNGMLASAKELDLFEDHTGIIELDHNITAGTKLTDAYQLDDYLIDIENKSLTHRPDTFGMIGFAREVSAILGNKFVSPDWLKNTNISYQNKDLTKVPNIRIDKPELSAQYAAVVLSNVDSTKQSPLEIQTYLARIGLRPISAPVDVTNYLMMASGQPMHTFDYDKLVDLTGGKPEIIVRLGRKGEKLLLLDGKEIEVTPDDIVISAGEIAIGLAGGMGCKNTAVDESTKNILLEVATFNLYSMRGTQMRHGIFSEAITRFTKGQPSGLGLPVLHEAVRLLGEWSGANPVSEVIVAKGQSDINKAVKLDADIVNKILGTSLTVQDIVETLERVEFEVATEGDLIIVTAPFWRTDIRIPEDVVEEVGRIRGYDNINPTIPKRIMRAQPLPEFENLKNKIRQLMLRAGANEVYTYSFVHGDDLVKNNLDKDNSYKIINAISPDLQYYRQSLTPSLLGLVHPNIKSGFENFAIYEINKVHAKNFGINDEKVPNEKSNFATVVSSKDEGATFFMAKRLLNFVIDHLGVEIELEACTNESEYIFDKPYETSRSMLVYKGNEVIGIVGEFKLGVLSANKLSQKVAGFELDIEKLSIGSELDAKYEPLSKYPSTERDVCFQVDSSQTYGAIEFTIRQALKKFDFKISFEPIDIYRSEGSGKKNITIKLKIEPSNKTLTSDEANKIINEIAEQVCAVCHASVL